MADLRAPDVCASLADSGPRRFAALRTSVRPPPASGPRQRTDDVQLTTVDEAGLRREALFRRTKRFGGPRRGASRPTKRGIMANVVPPSVVQPLTLAHRRYVQGLYRRALKQSLDWIVFRDLWRQRAIEIRSEFERHRDVREPRALATLLADTENWLRKTEHPDPYRPPSAPDGTKWERNLPPPIFPPSVREQARRSFDRNLAILEGIETELGDGVEAIEAPEQDQPKGGAVAPAS